MRSVPATEAHRRSWMPTSTRHGIGPVWRRSSLAVARLSFAAATMLLLLAAAPLQAQSIIDAQRVEFTPSADNNAFASDGTTPLVQSYTLTVYVAGSSTSFATANLGKPTPDTDGMMRVNFSTLLTT